MTISLLSLHLNCTSYFLHQGSLVAGKCCSRGVMEKLTELMHAQTGSNGELMSHGVMVSNGERMRQRTPLFSSLGNTRLTIILYSFSGGPSGIESQMPFTVISSPMHTVFLILFISIPTSLLPSPVLWDHFLNKLPAHKLMGQVCCR